MNGLYGTSPWGRQGIYEMDDAERERIEDSIPPGYSITVSAERQPGAWSVRLNQDGITIDRENPVHSIEGACWRLLRRLEEAHDGWHDSLW